MGVGEGEEEAIRMRIVAIVAAPGDRSIFTYIKNN